MERAEAHIPNNSQLIHDLGLERHELAYIDPRHIRLDRFELATELHWRIRLHIIHVDVTGTAPQKNLDDGLMGAFDIGSSLGFKLKQVSQGQAAQTQSAHREEI